MNRRLLRAAVHPEHRTVRPEHARDLGGKQKRIDQEHRVDRRLAERQPRPVGAQTMGRRRRRLAQHLE
jgi:hypothetical protein